MKQVNFLEMNEMKKNIYIPEKDVLIFGKDNIIVEKDKAIVEKDFIFEMIMWLKMTKLSLKIM